MEKNTKEVSLMVTSNAGKLLNDADQKTVETFLSVLEDTLKTYRLNKENNPDDIMGCMMSAYESIDESIDMAIDSFKKDNLPIPCKSGCSFCCYINVDITMDEGMAILQFLGKEKIETIKDEIKKRKDYTQENYNSIAYNDRKCMFLENDVCTIYPIRPIACRKYMVTSSPSLCNTKEQTHMTAVAVSLRIEMYHTAILQSNKTVGNIYEILNMIIEKNGI